MGVDLQFLVTNATKGRDMIYAHTILNLYSTVGYDFWEVFNEALDSEPLSKDAQFSSYVCRDDDYEEPHYGNTLEDAYGERLHWAFGRDIVKAMEDARNKLVVHLPAHEDCELCAALAYLKAIPNTKVVLYWR